MAKTFEELKDGAKIIKTNVLPESNTASLVGGELLNVIDKVEEVDRKKASKSDLDRENTERIAADQALSQKIEIHTAQLSNLATIVRENEEENASKIAELQLDVSGNSKKISDEVIRAKTAEGNLSNQVETESIRAIEAEKKLSDRVTAVEKETLYLGEFTSTLEQRVYDNADLIRKETARAIVTEQSLSDRITFTESDLSSQDGKLQEVCVLVGAKADQKDTYTKSDVDRIIEKTLSGGNCGCCGSGVVLINLNAPDSELWEKLSSNLNSRFNGYLTMGEEIFNLCVSWNPLGKKVEIARSEGMRTEIIILEKKEDGSILRTEEYSEYIY